MTKKELIEALERYDDDAIIEIELIQESKAVEVRRVTKQFELNGVKYIEIEAE